VADTVFSGGRQLGKTDIVVRWDKDRIISKPAPSGRFGRNSSVAPTIEHPFSAARFKKDDHTSKMRGPFLERDAFEPFQQEADIGFIRSPRTGIPGRTHAGFSV